MLNSRKNLWLCVGIPGSGKSTWIQEAIMELKDATYVSRDEIRFSLVQENEDYFSKETEVFNKFANTIQQKIDLGIENIFVDATHLNERSREKILRRLKTKDYRICAVYFDVPIKICLERNGLRRGRACVPDQVIIDMYRTLTDPTTDRRKYHKVLTIRN